MDEEYSAVGDDVMRLIGGFLQMEDAYVLHTKQTVWGIFATHTGAQNTRQYMIENGRGNSWSYVITYVPIYYGDEERELVRRKKRKKSQ
jgi:hypothetical protein